MEQTLGKRIMAHRKRLGLTQDQLAEKLGVTAQAVSKWENDQSCPDITMLPKLADIFGVTTDALLGMEKEVVHTAEVVQDEDDEKEPNGVHVQKGDWEFHFDGGKRSAIGFAVLVLLVGGLLLASMLCSWNVGFWSILWPSCLLVFGLFHLYPKFSFFSLGCALFGGYFLLDNLNLLPFRLGGKLLVPIVIILFGISLLVDALRKPKKPQFHVHYNNDKKHHRSHDDLTTDANSFEYSGSFGEGWQNICLSRMESGEVSISFGEYTIDLTGVEEVAEQCTLDANCSFGELTLRIPSRYRVHCDSSTAFANVSINGTPDPVCAGTIELDANVSFGEIVIQYV